MANILIIEDDPSMTEMATEVLEGEGHTIQKALGAEALVMAQGGGVDLVLLDLMMPIMSGGTVALYMHEHPATLRIPIILTTGVEGVEHSARVLGIRYILHKPFTMNELIGTVATVLAETRRDAQCPARPSPQTN